MPAASSSAAPGSGGGFWGRLLIWAGLNAGGDWVAKAFVPTGENEGHGYNCFP